METENVGILLIEGYPLIPFSCVLEVLRTANRLSNSDLFEWQFYARNRESVMSNSGISVPAMPLINDWQFPVISTGFTYPVALFEAVG